VSSDPVSLKTKGLFIATLQVLRFNGLFAFVSFGAGSKIVFSKKKPSAASFSQSRVCSNCQKVHPEEHFASSTELACIACVGWTWRPEDEDQWCQFIRRSGHVNDLDRQVHAQLMLKNPFGDLPSWIKVIKKVYYWHAQATGNW
jgi:hypothetical protein